MEEFIGKKIKVEFIQEVGWKRPVTLTWGKKSHEVKEIIDRWEEHTLTSPWWARKHRVRYKVMLDDCNIYELYWDRGARGKGQDWFLVKKLIKY
ncbi:MAG: hypothetical protein PHW62_01160 [Candidatus Ratteibacteria bacterium]|nr:hypothetical protein [Candidatus Ratteibacteria bacterium]